MTWTLIEIEESTETIKTSYYTVVGWGATLRLGGGANSKEREFAADYDFWAASLSKS